MNYTDVPDPGCIFVSGPSNAVAVGKPVVTVPEAYVFRNGSEVVGTISATYDFTNCPPELHAMAVNMLMRQGMTISIGSVMHVYFPSRYAAPEEVLELDSPSLWQRFRNLFTR